jgi:competence protein ComEA
MKHFSSWISLSTLLGFHPIYAADIAAKIDLNLASVQQITHSMKGLGVRRATAIVTYRQQHQGFHRLQELNQVPGLGKNFFEHHQQDIERIFEISSPIKSK